MWTIKSGKTQDILYTNRSSTTRIKKILKKLLNEMMKEMCWKGTWKIYTIKRNPGKRLVTPCSPQSLCRPPSLRLGSVHVCLPLQEQKRPTTSYLVVYKAFRRDSCANCQERMDLEGADHWLNSCAQCYVSRHQTKCIVRSSDVGHAQDSPVQ